MNRQPYTRRQLAQKVALTEQDWNEIRQCRRDHNRLGFAYQVGFVKLLNQFPAQQPLEIIDELLLFTSIQLNIDPHDIEVYQQRRETIAEHQERIRSYLRLKRLGPEERRSLEAFLFEECCRLEQTAALLARAETFLQEKGILLPAEYRLSRMVGEQRARAQEHIFAQIAPDLPPEVSTILDDLLQVQPGEGVSKLQTIKAHPSKPSAEAILALTEKLATIEATGVLTVDLSWLNSNYQRTLFHYVKQCSVDRLRTVPQPRRTAALVCFLWQSYRDAVDQLVDMYDKLITRLHTQTQKALDDQLKRQRQSIQGSMSMFKTVSRILLDDAIEDHQLRECVFAAIPQEQLAAQVATLNEWVAGNKENLFQGIVRRFSFLRRFSPAFVKALDFKPDVEGAPVPCLEGLNLLKELNADHKRKLPEETPTAFLSERQVSLVKDDQGHLDKHRWECALLVKLRDEIKAGNLAVQCSKRFGRFDDFFMPDAAWQKIRESFFRRSGLPQQPDQVSAYLRTRLGQAYDRFLEVAPDNSYATVDENGWHLSTDPSEKLAPEAQHQLNRLKDKLAQHMRRIKLPDLLIEVDNELGFTRHFMTPVQPRERVPQEVCTVVATLMAHGCNIGSYTMAQLIQDISYKQLKRVSDWQMTEEAQRQALAELVGAISGLDTSLHWGEGRTSASDGQRFALPKKVLQQTYSPKFSDFALEFYSFIADNYAPFYSTPIECTDRDAAFVLDGLYYNESELDLEEHYTDTHGYTEINFAAFAMLGRRFCPRIRGVQQQRIYRLDPDRDYDALASLVGRTDRTLDPRLAVEQWDRMGQFYVSLETGHTTASVALKRLAGYTAQNRFYRANRDLGRVFKTEFILNYMTQPQLRARIRRGLLKIEQLHALARDVYYGRRGRINARELHEQLNACSCLTLILACIIYWQAREIARVVSQYPPEEDGIDPTLLEHISPIEWNNVVLYGEYIINRKLIH